MPILYAGNTNIGQKRKTNQDSILVSAESNLFMVADGMGGHNGGDIASQTAVATLKELKYDPEVHPNPADFLSFAIKECNSQIFEKAKDNPELKGMGTTIVCAFFANDRLYIANVGDSRAYLFSKDQIFQLTRDHSLVQERVRHGIYSRVAARKDPMKNILVRSVGFEENLEVDIFEYKVSDGNVFLLCSDGLYNKMNDGMLIGGFKQHREKTPDTQACLDAMVEDFIEQSNELGGEDNISVIMLHATA